MTYGHPLRRFVDFRRGGLISAVCPARKTVETSLAFLLRSYSSPKCLCSAVSLRDPSEANVRIHQAAVHDGFSSGHQASRLRWNGLLWIAEQLGILPSITPDSKQNDLDRQPANSKADPEKLRPMNSSDLVPRGPARLCSNNSWNSPFRCDGYDPKE
jgi:hypothetical protein